MEIGLFQLENLLLSHARFCFLDLRVNPPVMTEPALDQILARAEKVATSKVLSHLKETKVGTDSPIVLICENGRTSAAASQLLEKSGYANVYVVEGGVVALLGEL